MAQFKRFNASENDNYNSSDAYPSGTLTWDPDNGLRIHDGDTSGGNQVGGGTVYWGDVQNRPYGNTAVHDLQGGSSSAFNGYFLKQTTTGVSEWTSLPTTYDTLTIDTKIIGGIDGTAGTQITSIEATLGSGLPYQYAFISGNDAFGNLFNRGSAIIGWKIYPANDPSQFVTITEYLNYDLGAPSLGFSGGLAQGPWIAESSDYNAGSPGPLVLSTGENDWTFGSDGNLTIPGSSGGMIKTIANASIGIVAMDDGTNNPAQMMSWNVNSGNPTTIVSTYSSNVTIQTDVTGTIKTWSFDDAGKLTLPAGGDIVDSSGTSVLGGGSGGGAGYEIKSADFNAEVGKTYWLNTGSSAKTVTLPASPAAGDWVKIYDGSMSWQTYNLTVNGNGNNVRTFNVPTGWNSPASTGTISQSLVSPAGPFAVAFVWDGTSWFSAI